MENNEVNRIVKSVIQDVALDHNISLPSLKDEHELVDDLQLNSLSVAAVVANLEDQLGFDPFEDEDIAITDLRTIKDLEMVYWNNCAIAY